MAGRAIINTERCKGCKLCASVCPNSCITISRFSNKNGFFPAVADNAQCTGCAMCALICSETVIEVERDQNIVTVESGRKLKSDLVREKG